MAHDNEVPVFEWLKGLGVVPENIKSMPVTQVRVGLDPDSIEAGYLASAAFEWDSWGPSSPRDFIDALSCELAGGRRDFISSVLTMLGREQEASTA